MTAAGAPHPTEKKTVFDLTRLLPLPLAFVVVGLTPAIGLAEQPAADPAEEEQEAPPEDVGFDLGSYHVKDFRPVEAAKTKLTFTLHALVAPEEADRFEKLLKTREKRIRDQVIISSRLSDPADFRDPQLRRFRRRIIVRLHRALPELHLKEVYLSEFRYVKQ